MPTLHQMENMQHVSRSGRPYPNIVHNVQSPALKQTRLPYIRYQGLAGIRDNPLSRIRSFQRMVESRIIYVNQKKLRAMLLLDFYQRGYTQYPPPMLPKGAHRPGLLTLSHRHISVQDVPTCELSVLFEIILHQALKQTGPPCIENSCEFPISGICGQ